MSRSVMSAVCGFMLLQLFVGYCNPLTLPKSFNKLSLDPEVDYDASQLITSKGYLAEEHWVETTDGYILGMHRIPTSKANHTKGPRPVFFLQHGLLGASTNWLTNLANESLAYILADNGYDVWMGNVRGNTYSKNHTTLKVHSKEFWNFTYDEHSQKDLPAMLDYVLKVTQQFKLFYVGHSQGTVMGFAGFSLNQTLASHIHTFFALAPVTTVAHAQGLFRYISYVSTEIAFVLDKISYGEFLPNNILLDLFAKEVCTADMQVEGLCGDVIFLICGFDRDNLNMSRVPIYYTHTPAGTSVKNTLHFSQEIKSERFAMYDYGDEKANIKHYGVNPSPAYNVSAMAVPTILFSGGKDWLADPTDVAGLVPILQKSGALRGHIKISYYDHLDFIWGLDAYDKVYNHILDEAKKLS